MFDAMINPFHLCADIQCIYLFKSLHIQYKMHSRDGHFVQIDFSLPLFPFSKFANVDTIFEQNSLPGEKPLSIWHETFWQPGRIFWRFKKSQAWKHLSSLTLPETNSSHLKMGRPKRKLVFIPTIHFQPFFLWVSFDSMLFTWHHKSLVSTSFPLQPWSTSKMFPSSLGRWMLLVLLQNHHESSVHHAENVDPMCQPGL